MPIYIGGRIVIRRRKICAALSAVLALSAVEAGFHISASAAESSPTIIAHRGSSYTRPSHSMASYENAIDLHADYIEPDLFPTRDGNLVSMHDADLEEWTNVREVSYFEGRENENGKWEIQDFTLAELKKLYVRDRDRPENHAAPYNTERIPTFQEVINLAKREGVGIAPEIKFPKSNKDKGFDVADLVYDALEENGLASSGSEVIVASAEIQALKDLAAKGIPKSKLLMTIYPPSWGGGPADTPGLEWSDMTTVDGLTDIAEYAGAIAPRHDMVYRQGESTGLVENAHEANLKVYTWTIAPDTVPGEFNDDEIAWISALYGVGIDGIYADYPMTALAAKRFTSDAQINGCPKAYHTVLDAKPGRNEATVSFSCGSQVAVDAWEISWNVPSGLSVISVDSEAACTLNGNRITCKNRNTPSVGTNSFKVYYDWDGETASLHVTDLAADIWFDV
ncbi:glycerophosphodiester phosphodiesterase family protein [Streptomyces sp. NPDC019396]|uniref:glycerophosphodiester phosphodiesterase family protein n=1 Tax=Streptomyces sp. NPDC019396 TaxID=3154687 RepID=UPI0033F5DB41